MKKFIISKAGFINWTFCIAIAGFVLYLSVINIGCQKEASKSTELKQSELQTVSARTVGETLISALGVYAAEGECTAETADYVVSITGDITGCLYTYVDAYDCSPGGTYREEGREHFVGIYKGKQGSFWTNYKFESKFEHCSPDGAPLGGEIKGRCQHPIVVGSGDGVFKAVTGRLDMQDNVDVGSFLIRGHLRF